MGKMRLRKKRKINILIPVVILLFLLITSCVFKNINVENSNSNFINNLLYYSNFSNENEFERPNLINQLNDIILEEPVSIVNKVFAYNDMTYEIQEEIQNIQQFSYIQNIIIDNPRVYIYSTHPNESYDDQGNVVLLSLLLQEKLNALGIHTIVEERSAKEYIEDNNLKFEQSYLATREFLQDKLNNNDFDLIIDLHRDAISRSATTFIINGETYARPMFVMNVNYENVTLANRLNHIIESQYPGLSRGIYNKYYDNFNQDLSPNVVLIEIGGHYNTFDEAINTIDILSRSIKELLE